MKVILFALLGPRLVCQETATSWDWVGPVRDPQLFARVGSELRCGELLKPLKELCLFSWSKSELIEVKCCPV